MYRPPYVATTSLRENLCALRAPVCASSSLSSWNLGSVVPRKALMYDALTNQKLHSWFDSSSSKRLRTSLDGCSALRKLPTREGART